MAMKEKIRVQRDIDLERIKNSENLTIEEKTYLTGLVIDAAACTNGLTHEEKVQNLSETTFGITTAIIKVTEILNENIKLTTSVSEKLEQMTETIKGLEKHRAMCEAEHGKLTDQVLNKKHSITSDSKSSVSKISEHKAMEQISWVNYIKILLLKPWPWIVLSVLSFSHEGIELIHMLIDKVH